eukprot:4015297-Pleurochrysis_carterae.AAC.1
MKPRGQSVGATSSNQLEEGSPIARQSYAEQTWTLFIRSERWKQPSVNNTNSQECTTMQASSGALVISTGFT